MQRLSGLDASFLYFESATQPLHVCALIEVDPSTVPGGYSFDALKKTLHDRLPLVPMFRRRLKQVPLKLDHPVWIDDENFDVDQHLHHVGVPAPGGREELGALAGEIAGPVLDRGKPLWEMWVIEGLANGNVAIVSKIHHATVDGVTGANVMANLCSLEPDPPPVEAELPEPEAEPGDLQLMAGAVGSLARRPLRIAGSLPSTLGVIPKWINRSRSGAAMPAPFTAPRTSFNGTVTGHRSVAFARTSLDDVKTVKNTFGTTVNDVVLAVSAGVLRDYLLSRGELPDKPLVATVPVSVHGTSTRESINKVSGMFSQLSTHIADPVERLLDMAARNRGSKEHHKAIPADMLQDWAEFAAPQTFGLAVRAYSALRLAERHPVVHNLVISNVPGPPMPLYFLGARIAGLFPLGPVFHGAGLNITVLSNDGHIDVGLLACRELIPDLWSLADGYERSLAELVAAAQKPGTSAKASTGQG